MTGADVTGSQTGTMRKRRARSGYWLNGELFLDYQSEHPEEGYRRLCYMMLDASSTGRSQPQQRHRVLKSAGRLNSPAPDALCQGRRGSHNPASRTPTGTSIISAYLNICGTFYYLCTVLDSYSRYIVHWVRETMTEADVETILLRAHEGFPGPRHALCGQRPTSSWRVTLRRSSACAG